MKNVSFGTSGRKNRELCSGRPGSFWTRLGFLLGFRKTFSGEHISNPKCDYYRGKKITITSNPEMILIPDGEIFGKTPITVTTLKNAINIAV